MFEPQQWNEPFAAECEVEACNERAVAVHAEPEAVRHLKFPKGEITSIKGNLAGIHEECAVKQPRGFPPVLGCQEQAISVLETEFTEPTQRLAPPRVGW